MQKNDKQKRGELQELFVNRLIYLLDERYGVGGWATDAHTVALERNFGGRKHDSGEDQTVR